MLPAHFNSLSVIQSPNSAHIHGLVYKKCETDNINSYGVFSQRVRAHIYERREKSEERKKKQEFR